MSVADFHNFISNIHNSDEFERLNGYTTAMMCNHHKRNDIKKYRKEWFVNNFTNFNNIVKQQYYDYYDKNITDTYSGQFAPPPCFSNAHDRYLREEEERIKKEIEDYQHDDVYLHYIDNSNKYDTIVKMQQYNNEEHSENEESFYESSHESSENISIYSDMDDYNDDDYYDVFDDETQYEDDYDY